MAAAPETHYARDGDAHLAYQIVGDGGPDLLFVPTAAFPIDLLWDEPTVAGHLRRLASFSRLILTDLLGVGSSDAVPINDHPAMQSWTDGLVAVLNAVESECVSIFAMSESTLPVMLLTASHPHRVRSLVLWSPFARFLYAADQPFGMTEAGLEKYIDGFERFVGTGALVEVLAPSWAGDAAKRRWWARSERLAGGPGYFKAMLDLFLNTDVRPALESIQAPTLLLRRRGDRHVRGDHARAVAERVRHARLVELDGDDHVWFAGDTPTGCWTRSSHSSPASAAPRRRTACCRPCCSPTSSDRPNAPRCWAMRPGRRRSPPTTASSSGTLPARVAPSSNSPATARWRHSTARRARSTARARSATRWKTLALPSAPVLHTGEVEMADGDVHGIAVHIAARIMALAAPGEVLVSGVIPPLVLGSRITIRRPR